MLSFRRSVLALVGLLSLPAGATDYAVEYGGGPLPAPIHGELTDDQTIADPVFERPRSEFQFCDSVYLGAFPYDKITFTNTGSSTLNLQVEVNTDSCDGNHDSVLYAYSPSFFPDAPTINCYAYNDDYNGHCSLVSALVMPKQTMVFVVTTELPVAIWPWTVTFNDHLFEGNFEAY